ncbi:type II toxin-antitoxin system TacA family antitoxin [Mycolicibacterium sp. XJ1819]
MAANAKTERMEFRAEEENLWRIRRAAVWSHEHVSEFVRKAALQRAENVEQQHLVTFMEPDQFDALMESLDVADAAPRLAAAARKPAVFKRR